MQSIFGLFFERHAAYANIDGHNLQAAGRFHVRDDGLLNLFGYLRDGASILDLDGCVDGDVIGLPKDADAFG